MKEFKGTKGKWKIKGNSIYADSNLLTIRGKMLIATCYNSPDETKKANTKLIASAPELLEALQKIVNNLENWVETGEVLDEKDSKALYDNAVKAINKAL